MTNTSEKYERTQQGNLLIQGVKMISSKSDGTIVFFFFEKHDLRAIALKPFFRTINFNLVIENQIDIDFQISVFLIYYTVTSTHFPPFLPKY